MRRRMFRFGRMAALGSVAALVATVVGLGGFASAAGGGSLAVLVTGDVTSTQGVPGCELNPPQTGPNAGKPESASFTNAALGGLFGNANGTNFVGTVQVGPITAYPIACLGPVLNQKDPNQGATVSGAITLGCLSVASFNSGTYGNPTPGPNGEYVIGGIGQRDVPGETVNPTDTRANCDPRNLGSFGGNYINLGSIALANITANFCVSVLPTCTPDTSVPSEAIMSIYIVGASPSGVSEAVAGPVVQDGGNGVPPPYTLP